MGRTRFHSLLAGMLMLLPGSVPSADESVPLRRLAWLTGCWAQEDEARRMQEHWMRPLGRTMIGMSRTVSDDRTVAYEHLRIEERDGRLIYTALPSGQQETSFFAVELTDDLVVFENLHHDFPQRIRYRRVSAGALLAQIEGPRSGQPRVIDFPMTRVECDRAKR